MLDASPISPTANSYVTLIEAELVANERLYTDAWNALSVSPSATGWLLQNSELAASTTIEIVGGSGTFIVGNVVRIAGVLYSIVDLTNPAAPIISPGLVAPVSAGASFERVTLSAREKALANATAMLDAQVDWDGSPVDPSQPLRWPRNSVYNCDENLIASDVFPQELKRATIEQAFVLAERNTAALSGLTGLGIKSAKVAELEVEIDGTVTGKIDPLPTYIRDLVACMGTPKSNTGSAQVRTVRV